MIQKIHKNYIRTNTNVIITNTFSADRTVLADSGHENDFEQINRRAVEAAIRTQATTGTETLITKSIKSLPTTSDMTFHDRKLSPKQLFRTFDEQAMLLADAKVDL